jgi:hypothetical protein
MCTRWVQQSPSLQEISKKISLTNNNPNELKYDLNGTFHARRRPGAVLDACAPVCVRETKRNVVSSAIHAFFCCEIRPRDAYES